MIRYFWATLLLLVSMAAASAQGSKVNIQCLTGTTPPWDNCSAAFPFPVTSAPSPSPDSAVSHASTTALGSSLVAKATAGNLFGFNCTAITGGVAGFCVAYNGSAAPSTGALIGSLVLDFCYYDTSARGCSLGRAPLGVQYSSGIVILVTSAVSPYTYTTGTNTAAVSADYK